MRRRNLLSVLVLVLSALALLAAGCGGDDNGGAAGTGGGDTGGGGGEAVKIVSDLPLQGSSAGQTETMVNAIKLYLEQIGGKAGDFTVSYESFDDSTAAMSSGGPSATMYPPWRPAPGPISTTWSAA